MTRCSGSVAPASDTQVVKNLGVGMRMTTAAENRNYQEWCRAWAAECLRVLKPGGRFIISVPNKWWIFETHGADLPLLPEGGRHYAVVRLVQGGNVI